MDHLYTCNSISEVISITVANDVVRLACDQSDNITSTLGTKVYFCLIAALRDSRPLLVDGLANAAPSKPMQENNYFSFFLKYFSYQ